MKFKLGDEVEVDYLPGQIFIISEIICYEIPNDTIKIYNMKITNYERHPFRVMEVMDSEIRWTKAHIRNMKLKELGI